MIRIQRLYSSALILMTALSVTVPARACVTTPQVIPREHIEVPAGEPVSLTILDLLTVTLPGRSAQAWRIDFEPGDAPLLRTLTPEQMASARESKRFLTMTRTRAAGSSRQPAVQLHFGAVATGSGKLILTDESRKPPLVLTMQVNVASRRLPDAPARGSVRKVDDTQQGLEIGMGYYDTLEVVLPGAADAAWVVNSASTGLVLKEKRALEGGKTAFVFRVDSTSKSGLLTIRNSAQPDTPVYGFPIAHRPTPVC